MAKGKVKLYSKLEHNGPVFPPEYQARGYTHSNERLPDLAEEMLWNFARYWPDTDHVKDPVFIPNFWAALKPELTKTQATHIFPMDFEALLRKMKATQEVEKEAKKNQTKVEKEEAKASRDVIKQKFGVAKVDGKDCEVMYMVEAPAILISRGADKRKGSWKYRVQPEDITINIVDAPVPQPPAGHNWKKVTNDPTLLNIFNYTIQCGPVFSKVHDVLRKKANFSATTFLKQNQDKKKFAKASGLLKNWSKVQSLIYSNCFNKDQKIKETALATYIIQMTGIRVGAKKNLTLGTDTRGVSTLCVENITFPKAGIIHLSFLGKDSVPFDNDVTIDSKIWTELKNCVKGKKPSELIFTESNAGEINKFIKSFAPDASAKLLRTCKCNEVLVNELLKKNISAGDKDLLKLRALYEANLEIAKTLNHQKNVGKNQAQNEAKAKDRVKNAEKRIKEIKAKGAAKLKKLQEELKASETLWTGEKLKAKKAQIKERKEKIEAQLQKAILSCENAEFALEKKTGTKDIALGTSLANYAEPKIIYSWCATFNVPIEKIYTPGLRKKYDATAMGCDKDFWKKYPNV